MSNASVTSHHLKIAKTHIAELKAERDYYKTRYEKSADYARELLAGNDALELELIDMAQACKELQARIDRAPEPTVNPITQRLRMRYMNWWNTDGPGKEAE